MKELLILFVLFIALALFSQKPEDHNRQSFGKPIKPTFEIGAAAIETVAEKPIHQIHQTFEVEAVTIEPAPEPQLSPSVPSRAQIVAEKLEEAWDKGFRSYSELIAYVKDETGQGCSKRTVSEWKKSQGVG